MLSYKRIFHKVLNMPVFNHWLNMNVSIRTSSVAVIYECRQECYLDLMPCLL